MKQTLTSWAAKSITSGTVTPAKANTLSANVAAIQNLSNREVLALSVLSKIYELNHIGGKDYRTNHAQLRTDATSFMGGFSLVDLGPAEQLSARIRAVIDWNAGYIADNTLGTDVATLVTNMAGQGASNEATLTMEYLFLLYQLAV